MASSSGLRLRAVLISAVSVALVACSPGGGSPSPSASPAAPPTASTDFTAEEIGKIDAAAMASLKNGTTGTIVSISDPARGTFLKAYGTADTAGTPMSPDLHYRIASVTKTFTAYAVLRLVDQGKVALPDPISRYVPDLPNGDRITLRDLLAMRSGVYDFANDQAFFGRYLADPTYPNWTADEALQIMRAHAPEFTPPDEQTVYCNSNYVLLGYVIEKATGRPAGEHLGTVIRELGLTNTSYPTDSTLPTPFVRGYLGDGNPPTAAAATTGTSPAGEPYRDVTTSNPAVAGTAGAMVSTVPDMTRYALALATGAGLSPATAEQRQSWGPLTPSGVRLQYGLGITQLGDWVGHDGSIFGYSNMVFHLPERQATVVVMNNSADEIAVPSQALWGEIVKGLYPDSLPNWN